MPWLGYTLGSRFADKIIAVDHWIAFLLLALIGGKMIKESFAPGYVSDGAEASLKFRDMLPLALATSIDALAVGVSFSFLNVHIAPAVAFIGLITLGLSMLGIGIGHAFGIKFKSKAEFIGGAILILMGLKILLEHLGVIFT
jgi:putative Mn2+ efflux pump MntP